MREKGPRDAVVVAYGRTPMARAYKGSFREMHPAEYSAQCLRGVISRLPDFDDAKIDDVVVGCANPESYLGQGYNIARQIAQAADLPDSVSAYTLTRFCASGLQSIASAANSIKANEMDVVAAGGCGRMTGIDLKQDPVGIDEELLKKKPYTYITMGMTAENVADQYQISRPDMEKFAERSHALAHAAQEAGKFADEIIPIRAPLEGQTVLADRDEGIRPGTTAEKLAALAPCFKEDGVITAAVSSQMTDGAAFLILMARETAEAMGYTPIARFLGFASAGVPAEIMGIGPIEAVPKVLKRTGLSIEDLDVIELNEAFASQSLAVIRELGFPMEKVNPNGGAIALGHPLGATGAVMSCKILSELKRTGGKYGLVTMCIGGGQGAAGIWEME